VFVNLFMNAIQAMPEGGELTLTTTLRTLDAPSDDIGARRTDRFRLGESVVVADIEDTGPGIPEDTFPKIFDPFFTTKPPGAGTGLGLTVTKKIIELHDGILVVKNRPCGGVRATVMLHVERGCQRHHGQKASAAH